MYEVTVQAEFSAAHRLKGYRGKCEELHGHNWKVCVTVNSERLDNLGMVIDFGKVKKRLDKVMKGLDHKYLNELPYFKRLNPTSENIAKYIFKKLRNQKPVTSNQINKVTVWETDTSSASYTKG